MTLVVGLLHGATFLSNLTLVLFVLIFLKYATHLTENALLPGKTFVKGIVPLGLTNFDEIYHFLLKKNALTCGRCAP